MFSLCPSHGRIHREQETEENLSRKNRVEEIKGDPPNAEKKHLHFYVMADESMSNRFPKIQKACFSHMYMSMIGAYYNGPKFKYKLLSGSG